MERDYNLEDQIGSIGGSEAPKKEGTGALGKIRIGGQKELSEDEKSNMDAFLKMTSGNQSESSNMIADGWIPIDRKEMGMRSMFYPEEWEFRVRPANVEAIKNWSSIDESNVGVTNKVFNEIVKLCFSIWTPSGKLPWSKMNSWDRFWFILKIREYTFVNGESKLEYDEECPYCDQPLFFNLTAKNLFYEFPDEGVIEKHYKYDERCWEIDPKMYNLDRPVQKLYVPTLEKDDAILNWAIREHETGKNINEAFLKFLPWMLAKAPKDEQVLEKFIKECKRRFDSWDVDLFCFMEDVLRNIQLTPSEKLVTTCPHCGEEVHSTVRFQNGVKSLFAIQNKYTKFGTK